MILITSHRTAMKTIMKEFLKMKLKNVIYKTDNVIIKRFYDGSIVRFTKINKTKKAAGELQLSSIKQTNIKQTAERW